MLGGVEDSINERGQWRSRGPATFERDEKREVVFSYVRPNLDHFPIDEGFDPVKLEEAFQCYDKLGDGWAKYAASEVSDDGEGDPGDGRVSPCTFTRWAQGAKRWDGPGDKYKSLWEKREVYDIPVSYQTLSNLAYSQPLFDGLYFTDVGPIGGPAASRISKHGLAPATEGSQQGDAI